MWHRRLLLFLIFPLAGLAQTGSINGVANQAISAATCLGANSEGVINGVSYTNCYAGSTFDVRVNAAMADAETLANGNTTGIVSSEYEPHAVSQTGQITVGVYGNTGGNDFVEWRLGGNLFSSINLAGSGGSGTVNTSGTAVTWVSGTQFSTSWAGLVIGINSAVYTIASVNSATSMTLASSAGTQSSVAYGYTPTAVVHNPNTSIKCNSVQSNGCEFANVGAANTIQAIYNANGNGAGYFRVDGVYFANRGSGSTMGSGHIGIINGGGDGSLWANSQWEDTPSAQSSNSAVMTITNICCHSNFTNDTFDSEWGATAVDLETPGHGINFQDDTFNTHGSVSGNPNILCHDGNPGTNSTVSFTGVTYMEGQTAAMSAPWIQDNGCQSLEFTGALVAEPHGGSTTTSPIIDVSGAFDTTLNIGNVAAASAGGTWTLPATIVKQHNTTNDCGSPPCNVAVTDSAGNSPGYHSRTSQLNNLTVGGALTANGTTTLKSPAVSTFAPSGFALNGAANTGGSQSLTPNAASTAVQIEYNITSKPVGCSTFPSVGIIDGSNSNAVICSIAVSGSVFQAHASCSLAAMTSGHTLFAAITTAAVGCGTNTGTAYVDLQYYQNTN
jgi:hypothetical protein